MHFSKLFAAKLVAVGVVLAVAARSFLNLVSSYATPSGSVTDTPLWYMLSVEALQSIVAVVPGLLVGYLAPSRGAALGFVVGLVGSIVSSAIYSVNWESASGTDLGDLSGLLLQLAAFGLGPAILGLVAGAAGQHFGARRSV